MPRLRAAASRLRGGGAVDYVYRIEQPHVSGQLAKVCAAIAEGEGLIGDMVTVTIGRGRARHEGGKLEVDVTVRVESLQDMRDVYTPGVARASRSSAA